MRRGSPPNEAARPHGSHGHLGNGEVETLLGIIFVEADGHVVAATWIEINVGGVLERTAARRRRARAVVVGVQHGDAFLTSEVAEIEAALSTAVPRDGACAVWPGHPRFVVGMPMRCSINSG